MVKDKCVDFEIRFVFIKSGKYEYRVNKDQTFVRYPLDANWEYQAYEKNYTHQESKVKKKVRFTALILWSAVISLLVTMLWPFLSEVLWPAFVTSLENIFS